MKKALVILFAVSIVTQVFPQTEKFDIASFIPPPGWQRSDTNGTVSYLDAKTVNGLTSFCQIILYPSSNSTANADKNFKTAWQNLIATPTKSKAKPATQTEQTPEGWTVVTGSANISFSGMNYKTILACINGFGKTMPVQVNTAGGDYLETLDKFFNDLNLDSKATVIKTHHPNNENNSNQTVMNNSIYLKDYDFITPERWQAQNNKDHLLIQNMQSGCAIRILEPQPSSGDLEKDAKTVFNMMYAGWQYQKAGKYQYALSKGILPKGLEFCMMEATMSMTAADGRYNLEEGAAIVISVGTQIVIISVRHNSGLMGHDECRLKYNTWRRFFNSFTVKNTIIPGNTGDATSRIIGAWSQTESGASSEYIFAANGSYALAGAIGSTFTSRDINYEYLHIKTYAFQGEGSYSIAGNELILKRWGDNSPEKIRFRFEKVNHGGTGWKDRIYLLKKDSYGENESMYEKQEK